LYPAKSGSVLAFHSSLSDEVGCGVGEFGAGGAGDCAAGALAADDELTLGASSPPQAASSKTAVATSNR
jgi:hypothetical protein